MKAKFWHMYWHTSIANRPSVEAIEAMAMAAARSVLPRDICAATTL